nr:GntR family transcriptional regulator [uncultured Enterobacter sp.]
METTLLNIKKVQKRSAEVQTAEVLREAIISGHIPLGTRLTEISVAEQLGVSRSTIRTAFHQLVQEGLIVQVPYTGWTVMTLSAQDAWELYTLRASLEALAARLVAQSIAAQSIAAQHQRDGNSAVADALAQAFTTLKNACTAGDKQAIAVEDMNLHKAIIALSGHGRLQDQYSRIQHQILIYIQSSDALVATPDEILAQHVPLIDALQAGDAEAAVHAAMAHNESEGAILVNYLTEN